jgi:hypothetical protein
MDALLERLDTKLREWKQETVKDVRHRLLDIIEWADHDAFDLGRSRELEQALLDILDEPAAG